MSESKVPQSQQTARWKARKGASGSGIVTGSRTPICSEDLERFSKGEHERIYEVLGAHCVELDDGVGTHFAVWAPNASQVSVIGDFNGWDNSADPLNRLRGSGVWEGAVTGVEAGAVYKYHIASRRKGYVVDKADPVGFSYEVSPNTASVVWDLAYQWGDADWMAGRKQRNALSSPISIYEVHLGSWKRVQEEGDRSLTYRELAHELADYVNQLGFTHVELLPVMEHPFYGSWGYETTGYFAPTSRYGSPQDFMYLVNHLHENGIGVILDWVPAHFPSDEYALGYFDGTHLYEPEDVQRRVHPDWNSLIFDYGRAQVQSFLISSALFWLDTYHVDGLRVDAVASMLYLDYSRNPGEWTPNRLGGRENLEALDLVRRLNDAVYREYPDVTTAAEESTAWPLVTRPTDQGGLGFGMKWDMGWMHDTLTYMAKDPSHRKQQHNNLTFRTTYAFSENFVLPLSHDEVVHMKGSLLGKMPGNDIEKFANLRLLLAWMYAQPGKKLLFMGGEFGQLKEWAHDGALQWDLLGSAAHRGIQLFVRDLNTLYAGEPALHELDFEPDGFEWIDCLDAENSIVSLIRRGKSTDAMILAVFNFARIPKPNYRVGVPLGGLWHEAINSDSKAYSGGGHGSPGRLEAGPVPQHGRMHSIDLDIPPLSAVFFRGQGRFDGE